MLADTYDEEVDVSGEKTGLTFREVEDENGNGVTITGGFVVRADEVTIDGYVIDNSDGDDLDSVHGVEVRASDLTLKNLDLYGPGHEDGQMARGVLGVDGYAAGLTLDNVTAQGWRTGVYLNETAEGAQVLNSNLAGEEGEDAGNYVGLAVEGFDDLTLEDTIFGGTFEDMGLGDDLGSLTATGNTFRTGAITNLTDSVITLGDNTVDGEAFGSVTLGTDGADTLTGTEDDDLLRGGEGDDTFELSEGDDRFEGGDGIDTVEVDAEFDPTKIGTDSDDRVTLDFDGTDTLEADVERVAFDDLTLSLVDDEDFEIRLKGGDGRPDLYFDPADLVDVVEAATSEEIAAEIELGAAPVDAGEIDLRNDTDDTLTITLADGVDSDDKLLGPIFADDGDSVSVPDDIIRNAAPTTDEDVDAEAVAAGTPVDFAVTDLLEDVGAADRDFGSQIAGIAVTGTTADGVTGSWRVRPEADDSFASLAKYEPSEDEALLLGEDAVLRFEPEAPGDDGEVTLTFAVVDDSTDLEVTSLVSGGKYADVTTRGEETAFSAALRELRQTFDPLNEPGELTQNGNLGDIEEDAFTKADGSLRTTPEDAQARSVKDLFEDAYDDGGDGGSLAGIAIVDNAASSEGVWEYSTDNGDTFEAIGAVAEDNALVLASDALIQFKPYWNFSGEVPELTVRSVDQTFEFGGASAKAGVDVTEAGPGSSVSETVRTIDATMTVEKDVYTFGLDEDDDATFDHTGNPGNVVEDGATPTVSLLNFRFDDDTDDVFRFDDEMFDNGSGVVVGNSLVDDFDRKPGANVLVGRPGVDDVEQGNVGDSFAQVGAEVRGVNDFFGTSFSDSAGAGIGIFYERDGEASVWWASEMNPNAANGDKDYVKLGNLVGEDWSLDELAGNDPDQRTVTTEELAQLTDKDFDILT
ncbi:MAG: hypothetical protein ACLFU0_02800 [Alphaproteobacteria bacterium]